PRPPHRRARPRRRAAPRRAAPARPERAPRARKHRKFAGPIGQAEHDRVGALDGQIQQFLDHLRVERELTPATVEAYGRDLSLFARFAADRKVRASAEVRPIDVLDFLAFLTERKLAPRSQARRLIALRQLFKFLKAERI